MTKRIKLVVAYDGTDFCGWAAQAGLKTVQGTLTEAVRQVSGENCEIIGASRTDSGAHAIGQVCHFDSSVAIEPAKWSRILNDVLPATILVKDSKMVSERFHARFCADYRVYRYRLNNGERDPFFERIAHFVAKPMDLEKMQLGANLLIGRHDFRAFTAELQPHIDNTMREIHSVIVSEHRQRFTIEIKGTAYMRGQMRRMSGALMEIGLGRRSVESISRLLDPAQMSTEHRPEVLPANGLMLMRVSYGRHPVDIREKDNGFDE